MDVCPNQAARTLLSVERRPLAGGQTTNHALLATSTGYHVASATGHLRNLPGAQNPQDALRRSNLLHAAHLNDETTFTSHTSQALTPEQILDAIRPTGPRRTTTALATEEDDHEFLFEDVNVLWSTEHHIVVNERHVYAGATKTGTLIVVPAEDYDRPYESWEDLLSLSWDSSDYAGVGMAGYGIEGLFRVRPGLLAHVSATDESLVVHLERVGRHASTPTLIRRGLHALGSDRLLPHLALARYGFNAADLYPDDQLACALEPAQIQSILRSYRIAGRR